MDDSLDITDENVGKLEGLVAAIKQGRPFVIEVDGERVEVPANADIEIEHDTEDGWHELEIQFYWDTAAADEDDGEDDIDAEEDGDNDNEDAGEDADEETKEA